jgi:mono/diheme cytochrome c family protein
MSKMILWAVVGLFLFLGVVLMGVQGPAWAVDGQEVYQIHCALCHGKNGKGDGPIASNFGHHPEDFTSPAFWQGDVDKKIADAVKNGKGEMIKLDLHPDQIKAVTEYIKKTFKK